MEALLEAAVRRWVAVLSGRRPVPPQGRCLAWVGVAAAAHGRCCCGSLAASMARPMAARPQRLQQV